ncbi:hypothetical protein [Pelistega europaea]|nr:hypothetical protein [Pelistega europaea]
MTPSASKKSDISLLSKTLFRLALPRIILRSVVIIIAIALWAWIAHWILDFGAQQDYAFLKNYSTQITEYLNSINKYIWWGIVLIGTIVLYFILSSYLEESMNKAGSIVPKQTVMENLLPQLSQSAKEVLIWVWGDQKEPITIKNLYDTRHELRSGRANRINQIRQQRALLGLSAIETSAHVPATLTDSSVSQSESSETAVPAANSTTTLTDADKKQLDDVQKLLSDISLDMEDNKK